MADRMRRALMLEAAQRGALHGAFHVG
jgi:hypothetical protein